MDKDTPAVKAALVVNGLRALKKHVAPAQFAEFCTSLSPAARALVETPPPVSEWVPLALRFEVFDGAFRRLLGQELPVMYQIGFDAHADTFKSFYRIFIKLLSPSFMLSRVRPAWQVNVRNCGSLERVDEGDRWLVLEYRGAPKPAPWFWEYNRGGMAGLASLTGVRNVRSTIVKGGADSNHCSIRVDWD